MISSLDKIQESEQSHEYQESGKDHRPFIVPGLMAVVHKCNGADHSEEIRNDRTRTAQSVDHTRYDADNDAAYRKYIESNDLYLAVGSENDRYRFMKF